MPKKTMILLLAIFMIFNTVGCNSSPEVTSTSNDNWKIGIVTGTVTQDEEPYRAAEQVVAKYGDEHVILKVYPDKYIEEQEAVIANILEMAANSDVKAIIAVPAIEGTLAAFEKARELRGDDILLISGCVAEDTKKACSINDFCLQIDEASEENRINEQKNRGDIPSLLDIEIPKDKEGDTEWIRNEIRKKLKENGLTGRFSIWKVPISTTLIKASSDYAVKWINGEITEKCDSKVLVNCFIDDTGLEMKLTPLEKNGIKYDNYFICSYK